MIFTLGSSEMATRSFAVAPVEMPRCPQCHGSPTWCTVRPCTMSGRMRAVTSARVTIEPRGVVSVT